MQGFFDTVDVYVAAIGQTLFITLISMVASGVMGLAIGLSLYATRPGNILESRFFFGAINLLVNVVRPIPFIIFLAAVAPLTSIVVGTTLGTAAVTFAISLAAAFAVSRIVEQNMVGVDPGVVEAARASGGSRLGILFTVVVPEGLGPLVLGYTFIFVGIIDMSAQAGLVGGGGLGNYAITYGSQRYDWGVVYVTVATIIVIVQVGQLIGNRIARGVMRR